MLFSRRTWLSFLMIGLLPVAIEAASTKRAAPTRPDQAADNATAFKGAIVMDAASGKILFEDRADYVGPPASVTKLMTFLLVQDRLTRGDVSLQTPVQVTAEAAKTLTKVLTDGPADLRIPAAHAALVAATQMAKEGKGAAARGLLDVVVRTLPPGYLPTAAKSQIAVLSAPAMPK